MALTLNDIAAVLQTIALSPECNADSPPPTPEHDG